MNKIFLVGNMTRDPELTTTNSGIALCRMGIAVNRLFSNQSGEREVDFFNIVAWRGLAENCHKYLRKGSKVAVSGSMQVRSYDDKDGNKRTSYEIVADDIEFLSSRNSDSDNSSNNQQERPKAKVEQLETIDDDDSLPF